MLPSEKSLFRRSVGVMFPRSYISILDVQIAMHDSDPGALKPAIICLHAIGHGGHDFNYFESAFSDQYRIITLDWPGQGYSSQDTVPASASRYTEILENVVLKMKLKNFVILGNSIGGATAIRFAAKYPQIVKALILSNPGGLDKGDFLAKTYIWWLKRKFEAGARGEPWFAEWFRKFYGKVLITNEAEAEKAAIISSAYEIAPRLAEAWRSFRMPQEDLRSLIPVIDIPVFFAWASADRYVQWGRNVKAVMLFKNREIVQFPAGHAPFLETPEAFNVETLKFLQKVDFT
jgi:pimeloyl-ACP methyl ester carboxylesterase